MLAVSSCPANRGTGAVDARLLRPQERRSHDGEPIANMFVSSRGGAVRRLIGSVHRHVIAMRRDPQMRFGQPTEGIAEGPAMMRCATDPDINFYQFQPFRIELPVAGKLASWICDVVYVTRDGSVHIREIKRSSADFAKSDYQAKLQAVKLTLSRLGWQFSPWTLDQIKGSGERQVNVANIYFDRAAHIDDLMPRFEELATETAETTYGELIRALDPVNTCRARAAVHRLIMKGRVWADRRRRRA
ncbi:hypothetical protein U4960_15770 [Altererythrobacter sp. H2]|uniref:hypothetical protein n=1 Tax=Altererythrobacter sp. H2 TaxID=3108391 RepID=UPI002B4BCAEE|nr:hypothetical protein [Altererythrobacter sp. H2]WRK95710.1 hypothetical protein U4960_15770 [Altererythrobacter sp. H2]